MTVYTLTNAVLLRPLPVRDPQGLVLLSDAASNHGKSIGHPARQGERMRVYSHPLYERLRAQQGTFAGLAAEDGAGSGAVLRWRAPAGTPGGAAETRVPAYVRAVSANYFEVLGVSAALGRTFTREDEAAREAGRVIVLSHGFWQRAFSSNPAIVGARIEVTSRLYTVIGVAAPGFTGTKVADATDLWFPLALKGVHENHAGQAVLYGIGPTDVATIAAAVLAVFAVATVAGYLPARRASRVDPMIALRSE